MDRNSWIGLVLIIVTLFTWSYFTKPDESVTNNQTTDSIQQEVKTTTAREAIVTDNEKPLATIAETTTKTTEEINEEASGLYGEFAPFATGERELITVENEKLKIQFSNLGGRVYSVELKEFKTHTGAPLILFEGDSTEFGLNFFAHNRAISTNQLFFNLIEEPRVGSADMPIKLVYGLNISDNRYIKYEYQINPDSYQVDFNIVFSGVDDLIASNRPIDINWNSHVRSLEKGVDWEEQNSTIFYKFVGEDVDHLKERSDDDAESSTGKVKWIAFKQQFFNVALIADNFFTDPVLKQELEINPSILKNMHAVVSLPYQGKEVENFGMKFYYGPNHYQTLKKYDLGLEELITLGGSILRWINVGIVIPVFNWLGKYINNYGIIILILTILIKLVLFPFTYKSFMSTAKMKALKPEVDKISEKYPKQEDAMKKQQATMALYKKVGVSPMGGCLPMLFQMPLLIAMFRFFPSSIELRQQGFLWADDLSSYDSILQLPFEIPWYGDHVSLFALLMTIVNVIYMKTNDQMNASNQQMPGMKTMMYMMPIMMLFWLNSYASALSYYYFISLLITIIQTWAIRRSVNDEEILAKLKAAQSSKKAPKKSKWQQRMEDMAKQRGVQPPKK